MKKWTRKVYIEMVEVEQGNEVEKRKGLWSTLDRLKGESITNHICCHFVR